MLKTLVVAGALACALSACQTTAGVSTTNGVTVLTASTPLTGVLAADAARVEADVKLACGIDPLAEDVASLIASGVPGLSTVEAVANDICAIAGASAQAAMEVPPVKLQLVHHARRHHRPVTVRGVVIRFH